MITVELKQIVSATFVINDLYRQCFTYQWSPFSKVKEIIQFLFCCILCTQEAFALWTSRQQFEGPDSRFQSSLRRTQSTYIPIRFFWPSLLYFNAGVIDSQSAALATTIKTRIKVVDIQVDRLTSFWGLGWPGTFFVYLVNNRLVPLRWFHSSQVNYQRLFKRSSSLWLIYPLKGNIWGFISLCTLLERTGLLSLTTFTACRLAYSTSLRVYNFLFLFF